MNLLFAALALADPAFDGTLKELSLDAPGGFNGAPEGMTFIALPGAPSVAEYTTFADGNKGARLSVKGVGDSLVCTQPVALGPQVYLSARVRVPEIVPGGGSWMGMNAELRARDDRGTLVSPPGMMFTMLKNIREPLAEWTEIDGKLAVPTGATQGEFCFRFVLSTGVVEIDKVRIVSRRAGAEGASVATSAPVPAPAAPAPAAPAPAVPAPAAPVLVASASAPPSSKATTTAAPVMAPISNTATTASNDGSSRGFTLRLDQRASSVACSKWVPASTSVTVFGTVDITAINAEAVDWSGLAVEAYARDAADKAVVSGGVPYAPLFVATQAGLGQRFSVSWKPPAGSARVRLCARFSDAAGNAVFDWSVG